MFRKALENLGFPLPSIHELNLACPAPRTDPREQDAETHQPRYSIPGPPALLSTQVAVVVEELPSVSTYLQSQGWRVLHYNHGHVNSAGTARLSQQLKQQEVTALWLDLPVAGRHVKEDRLSSHMSQLCTWLQLCEELGTPAVLFGPYGRPWLSPAVKDLCARGTIAKSYHRICAWSYKLDAQQKEPSSTCFVAAAAARALPGHACNCSVRQSQHRLDWSTAKMPHQRRLRAQLHAAVAAHVAEQWAEVHFPPRLRQSTPDTQTTAHAGVVSRLPPARVTGQFSNIAGPSPAQFSSSASRAHVAPAAHLCQSQGSGSSESSRAEAPDPHSASGQVAAEVPITSAFPTEARQQQKARMKQLKALGIKPKTRRVYVEEHHDDCGTSLESLSAFMPEEPELHSAHWVLYQQAFGLPPFWLLGSNARPSVPSQPHSCFIAGNFEQAASALACWPPGDSELCILSGGHEGTALLSVRRRIFPGSYLKLVAQVDPDDCWFSSDIIKYALHAKPLVFVLLPTWGPATANPPYACVCTTGFCADRS